MHPLLACLASQIIVTGNEQDGWEFVEVAANGSRRGDAGFRLDDEETRGGQARKDIMAREMQLVEGVAFDKASHCRCSATHQSLARRSS